MRGAHEELNKEYFPSTDHQSWIKSLITLGTPHIGTTVTDVVQVVNTNHTTYIMMLTRTELAATRHT